MTLVEAVVALGIGVGGGVGFLYGTGDMKGAAEVATLQGQADQLTKDVEQARAAAEAARQAEMVRLEAERRAAQEAMARAAAERVAAERAAAEKAAAIVANAGPKFGQLTIKALAGALNVDGGPGLKGTGKVVDLAFEEQPGKVKVKAGRFTVVLTPRPMGRYLGLDVSVSPLAIIKADGVAMGTSASNLEVTKSAFKLDFSSPASGDLNLILQYKK